MTVDYFAELGRAGGRWPALADTDAVTTCYHFLVATGHKKDKDTGADALRSQWAEGRLSVTLSAPDAALWQWIATPAINLSLLPSYSFTLRFTFTLAQPYLSKDDNPFYILDNPIVRDRVFGLPLVRPSSWKGNLRAALWQLGYRHDGEEHTDEQIRRLFGETRGEETGQAGRLFFYPTFFTQTALEIINPHDRTRRVGKNPILFESVPAGAQGTFSLLYVPFDLIGQDESETRGQAAADLCLVAKAIRAMMLTYGFSAKRTSGFGLAKETVSDGVLTCRVAGLQAAAPPAPKPASASAQALPRYLEAPGRLRPEYLTRDGRFRERSEAELKTMKKADRQLYEKARAWWEREGKALAEREPEPGPPTPAPSAEPAPTWPAWPFRTFDELVAVANQVAQQLAEGGAQ